MQLSQAQLAEFKAEGALPIRGLVPPDVIDRWQDQLRAVCTDGVDLDDPDTWSSGRYAPPGGWPQLDPNLYDVPNLQSIVAQLGAGAFAPSHPAGQPWSPQVPMTRVILPSAPGTEWRAPTDGHLDGYATGWGGGLTERTNRTGELALLHQGQVQPLRKVLLPQLQEIAGALCPHVVRHHRDRAVEGGEAVLRQPGLQTLALLGGSGLRLLHLGRLDLGGVV